MLAEKKKKTFLDNYGPIKDAYGEYPVPSTHCDKWSVMYVDGTERTFRNVCGYTNIASIVDWNKVDVKNGQPQVLPL